MTALLLRLTPEHSTRIEFKTSCKDISNLETQSWNGDSDFLFTVLGSTTPTNNNVFNGNAPPFEPGGDNSKSLAPTGIGTFSFTVTSTTNVTRATQSVVTLEQMARGFYDIPIEDSDLTGTEDDLVVTPILTIKNHFGWNKASAVVETTRPTVPVAPTIHAINSESVRSLPTSPGIQQPIHSARPSSATSPAGPVRSNAADAIKATGPAMPVSSDTIDTSATNPPLSRNAPFQKTAVKKTVKRTVNFVNSDESADGDPLQDNELSFSNAKAAKRRKEMVGAAFSSRRSPSLSSLSTSEESASRTVSERFEDPLCFSDPIAQTPAGNVLMGKGSQINAPDTPSPPPTRVSAHEEEPLTDDANKMEMKPFCLGSVGANVIWKPDVSTSTDKLQEWLPTVHNKRNFLISKIEKRLKIRQRDGLDPKYEYSIPCSIIKCGNEEYKVKSFQLVKIKKNKSKIRVFWAATRKKLTREEHAQKVAEIEEQIRRLQDELEQMKRNEPEFYEEDLSFRSNGDDEFETPRDSPLCEYNDEGLLRPDEAEAVLGGADPRTKNSQEDAIYEEEFFDPIDEDNAIPDEENEAPRQGEDPAETEGPADEMENIRSGEGDNAANARKNNSEYEDMDFDRDSQSEDDYEDLHFTQQTDDMDLASPIQNTTHMTDDYSIVPQEREPNRMELMNYESTGNSGEHFVETTYGSEYPDEIPSEAFSLPTASSLIHNQKPSLQTSSLKENGLRLSEKQLKTDQTTINNGYESVIDLDVASMSMGDLYTLKNGVFLDGMVIDFMTNCSKKAVDYFLKGCVLFSSSQEFNSFIQLLDRKTVDLEELTANTPHNPALKLLMTIIRSFEIFKTDFLTHSAISLPLFYQEHWAYALVVNPGGAVQNSSQQDDLCRILFFNSGGSSYLPRAVQIVVSKVIEDAARRAGNDKFVPGRVKLYEVKNVPKQTNGFDCGLYVIHYIREVMRSLEWWLIPSTDENYYDWNDHIQLDRRPFNPNSRSIVFKTVMSDASDEAKNYVNAQDLGFEKLELEGEEEKTRSTTQSAEMEHDSDVEIMEDDNEDDIEDSGENDIELTDLDRTASHQHIIIQEDRNINPTTKELQRTEEHNGYTKMTVEERGEFWKKRVCQVVQHDDEKRFFEEKVLQDRFLKSTVELQHRLFLNRNKKDSVLKRSVLMAARSQVSVTDENAEKYTEDDMKKEDSSFYEKKFKNYHARTLYTAPSNRLRITEDITFTKSTRHRIPVYSDIEEKTPGNIKIPREFCFDYIHKNTVEKRTELLLKSALEESKKPKSQIVCNCAKQVPVANCFNNDDCPCFIVNKELRGLQEGGDHPAEFNTFKPVVYGHLGPVYNSHVGFACSELCKCEGCCTNNPFLLIDQGVFPFEIYRSHPNVGFEVRSTGFIPAGTPFMEFCGEIVEDQWLDKSVKDYFMELSDAVIVPENAVGVPENAVGVPANDVGVPENAVGVPENAVGVPENAVGVPESAVGVPENAVGVPENAVGVPANDVGVLYDLFLNFNECTEKFREQMKEISARKFHIDCKWQGNASRFLAHGCIPNVEQIRIYRRSVTPADVRLILYTIKDIQPGGKILIDYGPGYFKHHKMRCGCRTARCLRGDLYKLFKQLSFRKKTYLFNRTQLVEASEREEKNKAAAEKFDEKDVKDQRVDCVEYQGGSSSEEGDVEEE